ncbi:MAG: RluA family pseudouridine synthase [Oscillospiraceae bacterium]|nr:RluA family pseudouridine synthase [Oscillospiraceae bacterium]
MTQFTITPNDAAQRLDKFLQKAAPNLPPAALYKALRTKHIKVNRKRAEGSTRLQVGDVVDCYLPDEFFAPPAWQHDFLCAPAQLRVLYEDEHILLANKPAGLLSHAGDGEYIDNLLARIQRYLHETGEYNPDREHSFAPALVNRIDRNTQGIVIAAKTAVALRVLNEKMKARQLRKFYLCAVHGGAQFAIRNAQWQTITSYMRKDEQKALVRVYDTPHPGAKECITRYRSLAHAGDFTLVQVELLTGRTHQIRAQFAHMGHALVGDGKYAPRALYQSAPYKSQCLCAWQLTFDFSGEKTALDYLHKLDIFADEPAFLSRLFPDTTLVRENPGG